MKKIIYCLILVFIISCKKDNQTIIKGNIPNLPDGVMYLFKDNGTNKIDSVITKNGKFKFKYKWEKNDEPVFLGLHHLDKKGVDRWIGFPGYSKFRGDPLNQSVFFSDPEITINGEIFDNSPKNFPKKLKFVDLKTFIIAGKQTEALYNVDGDLFDHVNGKTIKIIEEKINKYPYSYYLLTKITENKNSFTAQQVQEFLKLFNGEITKSDTYKKLNTYNNKRFNESKISLPLLENEKGEKLSILDKKYKKHLIIFWASWCGPCRAEIPLLKKVYASKNPNTEFISVSTDDDKNAWKKTESQEKMSWKQFILNKNTPAYENFQIRLKLNSAIPYTVLVDSNLKIIAFSVGLSTADEIEKLLNTK